MSPIGYWQEATDDSKRLWISGIATVLIAMIVGLIYLGIALQGIRHTQADIRDAQTQIEQNRKLSDEQRAEALRVTDRKFRDALRASTLQSNYSINKSTCLLRTVATQQFTRIEKLKQPGWQQASEFWHNIKDGQVPIPITLNCSKLPKHPPKPTKVQP